MLNNFYKFKDLSILLPVIDEKKSLIKTISIILKENPLYIKEIILILDKKKTKKRSKEISKILGKKNKIIKKIYQTKPKLGGALINGIELSKGSHILIMSSDLETDPSSVKKMLKKSINFPNHIIQASRWESNNSFNEYGMLKEFLNFIFQKMFSYLFNIKCNDLTFGFRILPQRQIRKIKWEMLDHSFLFESLLKPAIRGTKIMIINSNWNKRTEGKSNNQFLNYFRYIFIGLKLYFKKY